MGSIIYLLNEGFGRTFQGLACHMGKCAIMKGPHNECYPIFMGFYLSGHLKKDLRRIFKESKDNKGKAPI